MDDIVKNLKKEISKLSQTCSSVDEAHEIAEIIRTIKDLENYSDIDYSESDHAWILAKIESEIKGSQEYYSIYEQTKEPMFKQMAKDELRHAEFLHGYAFTQGADRQVLEKHKSDITDMLHRLQ